MDTRCSNCGKSFIDVPDEWQGKKVRCEACGNTFICGASSEVPIVVPIETTREIPVNDDAEDTTRQGCLLLCFAAVGILMAIGFLVFLLACIRQLYYLIWIPMIGLVISWDFIMTGVGKYKSDHLKILSLLFIILPILWAVVIILMLVAFSRGGGGAPASAIPGFFLGSCSLVFSLIFYIVSAESLIGKPLRRFFKGW